MISEDCNVFDFTKNWSLYISVMNRETREEIETSEKIAKRLMDAIKNVNDLFLQARDAGLYVMIQKDEIYDGKKPVLNRITVNKATYSINFIEQDIQGR